MSLNPITIGADSYPQLEIGRYIRESSTAGQPELLNVDSTINPDGTSSFVVKLVKFQDAAVAGQADSFAQCHLVGRWTPAMSITDVEALLTKLKTLLTTGNLAKIAQGRR